MIVLGLDEAAGFVPAGLADPRELKAAVASKARQALEPPIIVDLDDAVVDGETVIVGVVHELDLSHKPCRVIGGTHRGVWIRSWDGDYQASELEIQGLLTNRTQPRFDSEPAPQADRVDLDDELVGEFLGACRAGSEQLAGIRDDEELLWRMGVLVGTSRVPSVAGVLALGRYPQQHMPATGLQAVLIAPADDVRTRALDSRRFDGPIPRIIADATNWVARSAANAIVNDPTSGQVRNRSAWPPDAVRELVGNVLIHRDLAPWAMGETALLRLDQQRLVVKNPGGLYGLHVNRLGQVGVTSARNANLVRICQFVRLPDGTRAAEALASGIPTVLDALQQAAMPAPIFDDDGLRFTVVLRQRTPDSGPSLQPGSSRSKILLALAGHALNIAQLQAATGLEPANLRKHLRALREQRLITQHGGQGQRTTYTRTP